MQLFACSAQRKFFLQCKECIEQYGHRALIPAVNVQPFLKVHPFFCLRTYRHHEERLENHSLVSTTVRGSQQKNVKTFHHIHPSISVRQNFRTNTLGAVTCVAQYPSNKPSRLFYSGELPSVYTRKNNRQWTGSIENYGVPKIYVAVSRSYPPLKVIFSHKILVTSTKYTRGSMKRSRLDLPNPALLF